MIKTKREAVAHFKRVARTATARRRAYVDMVRRAFDAPREAETVRCPCCGRGPVTEVRCASCGVYFTLGGLAFALSAWTARRVWPNKTEDHPDSVYSQAMTRRDR